MILITDVVYTEVKGDIHKIMRRNVMDEVIGPPDCDPPIDTTHFIEHIQGKRFVNARGEKIVIGITSDVEKLIGLPMEVFEMQQREIDKISRDKWELRKRFNQTALELENIERYPMRYFIRRLFLG